jgi:hypothetical protein
LLIEAKRGIDLQREGMCEVKAEGKVRDILPFPLYLAQSSFSFVEREIY